MGQFRNNSHEHVECEMLDSPETFISHELIIHQGL
jgi:hypothetical protein